MITLITNLYSLPKAYLVDLWLSAEARDEEASLTPVNHFREELGWFFSFEFIYLLNLFKRQT